MPWIKLVKEQCSNINDHEITKENINFLKCIRFMENKIVKNGVQDEVKSIT